MQPIRKYRGQDESEALLQWLNEARPAVRAKKPYAQVVKLVSILKQIPSLDERYRPFYLGTADPDSREAAEIQKRSGLIQDRCNEILACYSAKPSIGEIRLGVGHIFTHWRTARSQFKVKRSFYGIAWPFTELDAVLGIIRLAEIGAIARLRQCDSCLRWFLAKYEAREAHTSCSPECRKTRQQGPEFRARRAEYMRGYRHDNRVREKTQDALFKAKMKVRQKNGTEQTR